MAGARRRASVDRGSARADGASIDLGAGIEALGLALSGAQRDALRAYLALLAKWNHRYNLTAIREPARMVTHHVLDTLAVLSHLPHAARLRVLDVGSGGGVPGIVLAIARPDWHVTMLDANQKKGAFLTQATIELGLADTDVAVSRVEDFAAAAPYDVVISRAFASLADFAASSTRHVAPRGALYAMKGVMPDDEIAALPPPIEVVAKTTLVVPGLDAARSLVTMRPRGAHDGVTDAASR
jgi:16S rRNA (guanine527-N7)-methyltransferase